MIKKIYKELKKYKDKAFYYFAVKNWGVRREYIPFKDNHPITDKKHPLRMWWMLIRLNVHYRILRRKDYLYCIPGDDAIQRGKLPYLDGSESEAFSRAPAIQMAMSLLAYDIISFDIFDTLLLRPFAQPTDIFLIIGKRLNKSEFYRIRIDAEKTARDLAEEKTGNREITIDDIYAIIERQTGIPKEIGIKTELDVETQYCFPNPYMKRVFRLLKRQGKRIVIVSDMYISHDRMEKLLKQNGIEGYEKLYVSCDYHANKRSGELYKIIQNDFPGMSFIHVGDNQLSDVESATEAGWESRHYTNCHEIGNQFRADGMSPLIGSAYAGIVNTHLHNGNKSFSPYYEYGFIYGGLYVLGFCHWMYERAKAEEIDKILFLARDGIIYQRVFNMLYQDIPNEYCLWSRLANSLSTLKKNREDFLRRYIFYRAIAVTPQDIGTVMESSNIGFLCKYCSEYGLCIDDELTRDNYHILEELITDHWDEICKYYENNNMEIREYILSKIGNAERVAIVDVGWLASGPIGLKYLIEDEYKTKCKVFCWIAAAAPPQPEDNITEIMDGTIETYLFNIMNNRINYDTHKNSNARTNNLYFEMFTQAKYPSFKIINQDGSYEFSIPDIENYSITDDIHQGIFDFCKIYFTTFQTDPYMLNISGYDSYCAFRMIIRDLSFIKKFFGSLSASRLAGGNEKKQKIETLAEILKDAGIG